MLLEYQVVSLELAKKLKELGVKQESLFYWVHANGDGIGSWDQTIPIISYIPKIENYHLTIASAFTVAELGEMLPNGIQTYRAKNGYRCAKGNSWSHIENGPLYLGA
jgi:hypothetical protein